MMSGILFRVRQIADDHCYGLVPKELYKVGSFFDFFGHSVTRGEDGHEYEVEYKDGEYEDGDIDEYDEEESVGGDSSRSIDCVLYADFELGNEFKESLIPHALYWHTGEAALSEVEFDDDDE
jgi:Nucleosome assembly protein (NAP)